MSSRVQKKQFLNTEKIINIHTSKDINYYGRQVKPNGVPSLSNIHLNITLHVATQTMLQITKVISLYKRVNKLLLYIIISLTRSEAMLHFSQL